MLRGRAGGCTPVETVEQDFEGGIGVQEGLNLGEVEDVF
jgi:hypothetical protein